MQTIVHTPTTNIDKSLSFYKDLNFKIVSKKPMILSGGKFFIEINSDKHARAGVKIIKESWATEIKSLTEHYPSFKLNDGYLLRDNNGIWVYLIEGFDLDLEHTKNKTNSHLGNFMGMSVETTSFDISTKFWNTLGFVQVSGVAEQGWIVLANADGFAISFMLPLSCPHSFTNPSLTFFNGGNNLDNIEKIRLSNIPIKEEITTFNTEGDVDNIIIEDPGGYGMFIFND